MIPHSYRSRMPLWATNISRLIFSYQPPLTFPYFKQASPDSPLVRTKLEITSLSALLKNDPLDHFLICMAIQNKPHTYCMWFASLLLKYYVLHDILSYIGLIFRSGIIAVPYSGLCSRYLHEPASAGIRSVRVLPWSASYARFRMLRAWCGVLPLHCG